VWNAGANVKHSFGGSKADALPPISQVAPESAPQTPIAPRLQPDSLQAPPDASQAQPDAPPALFGQNLDDTQLVDQHGPMNVPTSGASHLVVTDAGPQHAQSLQQPEYSQPELQPPCESGFPADENAATGALHGVKTGSLAGIPDANEIPSPWVAYDYSLWDDGTWERLSSYDAELYYYHYVQFTLQQGWTSAEWESYGAEFPECYEYVNYYWYEWSVKGAPRLPLPRIGQPLASGEVVTTEWLQAAQNECVGSNNMEDAASNAVMPGDVQSPTSVCKDRSLEETSQEATPTLEPKVENAEGSSHVTSAFEDPSTMSGWTSVCNGAQLAHDAINTTATDGNGGAGANFSETVGDSKSNILTDAVACNNAPTFHVKSPKTPDAKHWKDDSLLRPLALETSPEPDPDEADLWPDAEDLRAAVALYATDMRDESIAASDDEAKFRALDGADDTDGYNPSMGAVRSGSITTQMSLPTPRSIDGSCMGADGVERCTGSSFQDSSRDLAMEYAAQRRSSIGGAVAEEDEEDGFGDVRRVDALASPSGCKGREQEASILSGPLSSAAANADADAALQYLEATLEKSVAEKHRESVLLSVNDAAVMYAPPVHFCDAQSEVPSSMVVNAPSEAVMEEDIPGRTPGFSELPNVPGVAPYANESDALLPPPMHGGVPSTTRPEIGRSDLGVSCMRVPRGSHSCSCDAEAPSAEATSEKGSEEQEVMDSCAHSEGSNAHAVSDVGIASPSVRTRNPRWSAEDGAGSGHPAEVMRQLALHMRKINDILGFASETAVLPPDVIGHFHAVWAANNSMLEALTASQVMDPELHLMTLEPSTGAQACYATPFCVRCCLCWVC
jgi:hypothetical protein